MPAPDLAGYRDAQTRLIALMGASVTFGIPAAGPTWPASATIDPETHEPYDPTVTASAMASAASAVTVKAIRINPSNRIDDVTNEVLGQVENFDLALGIRPQDYDAVKHATTVTTFGITYRVTEIVPRGIDQPDSYIVFCEAG